MADASGSGTATPGSKTRPSWNGGSVPATLDPKDLGTKFLSDVDRIYSKGPQVNPYQDYVPYSTETSGLIREGMGNNSALRSGTIGNVASGAWLKGGNPYFEDSLSRTRDNIATDVNSTFASNGRFGSDIHAEGLAKGLGDAELAARDRNFETEYGRMADAQGRLDASTAQALGYSGLLDTKNEEKNLSDQNYWDDTKNANFNHLAKYLGLLRGGDTANETNKPLSLWDILGGIGSTAGAFL